MKQLIFTFTLVLNTTLFAQFTRGPIPHPTSGVLDGVYIPENIPTKRVIPYEHVREADVAWSKRVWSVIDLRQKFNHALFYPMDDIQESVWNKNITVWSLWTIIRQHVMNGELTIYSPFNPNWEDWKDGDSFKYPVVGDDPGETFYSSEELRNEMFMYLGTVYEDPFAVPFRSVIDPTEDSVIYNPVTEAWEAVYPAPDTSWFTSKDIIQYKLKEDWFFNKETSKMDRRIIGIAPIIHQKDVNGNITGERELFWLYFPQCRYVFQNYFVANRQNDAQRMSLDDLFWKRMFQSFIVKESNLYNRDVDSYRAGQDAILESEQIESRLNSLEHDLWSF